MCCVTLTLKIHVIVLDHESPTYMSKQRTLHTPSRYYAEYGRKNLQLSAESKTCTLLFLVSWRLDSYPTVPVVFYLSSYIFIVHLSYFVFSSNFILQIRSWHPHIHPRLNFLRSNSLSVEKIPPKVHQV